MNAASKKILIADDQPLDRIVTEAYTLVPSSCPL